MVKKILQKALMVLTGMLKSGIVGSVVGAIAGVILWGLGAIGVALTVTIFLLPAMFLYHLCRALNFNNLTCDILYFVGFISILAIFIHGSCAPSPSGDGADQWCRFLAIVLFFNGVTVYLAEVYFRNRKIRNILAKC